MDLDCVARILAEVVGADNVKVAEPMRNHTSFKVGGPADILVTPGKTEEVQRICEVLKREKVPLFTMGNGTNLIVRDKGIRGVVIKLAENLGGYRVDGGILTAEAGVLISRLSRIALEHSLTGLEFAEGIPGTVGGAVTMNAGAYDGEMAAIVLETEYLDNEGNISVLTKDMHKFGKRSSFIQTDGGIVLKTRLLLKEGQQSGIKAMMDEYNRQRHQKQPLDMPSAGSIFKRPEGYFAGKLIQDCGLKGCRTGGAEVSLLHCGFIVNTGNASARDITALIKLIQDTVYSRFGIELLTEVKIVGEE